MIGQKPSFYLTLGNVHANWLKIVFLLLSGNRELAQAGHNDGVSKDNLH